MKRGGELREVVLSSPCSCPSHPLPSPLCSPHTAHASFRAWEKKNVIWGQRMSTQVYQQSTQKSLLKYLTCAVRYLDAPILLYSIAVLFSICSLPPNPLFYLLWALDKSFIFLIHYSVIKITLNKTICYYSLLSKSSWSVYALSEVISETKVLLGLSARISAGHLWPAAGSRPWSTNLLIAFRYFICLEISHDIFLNRWDTSGSLALGRSAVRSRLSAGTQILDFNGQFSDGYPLGICRSARLRLRSDSFCSLSSSVG